MEVIMRTICAWCKAEKCNDGDPATVLRVSHGICRDCADKLEADARETGKRVNAFAALYRATGMSIIIHDDVSDLYPVTPDERKRTLRWLREAFRYRLGAGVPACQRVAGL